MSFDRRPARGHAKTTATAAAMARLNGLDIAQREELLVFIAATNPDAVVAAAQYYDDLASTYLGREVNDD